MDQVMDLDALAIWARVIVEKGVLSRKVMPMAMENLSIAQHWDTLGMHIHKVAITNLRWDNLMLVILCIFSGNQMIL